MDYTARNIEMSSCVCEVQGLFFLGGDPCDTVIGFCSVIFDAELPPL